MDCYDVSMERGGDISMWISKERVEEDLQERFQEHYPKVRRYLRIESYVLLVIFSLVILSFLPYTRQYFWWMIEDSPLYFPIGPLLIIAMVIVQRVTMKKYQLHEKLKGSLYRRRSTVVSLPIISLLFIGLFSFWMFYEQTASEAAAEFGRGVQVPTYFPFTVKSSSGDASVHKELQLDYTDGNHTLEMWISDEEPKEWDGTVVTLADGTKAWYNEEPGDLSLEWYRGGFLYELILEDPQGDFTQEDIIKVANSFQPVESK